MLRNTLLVALTLLTAACVPIPPEPPAASAPLQTAEPAHASEETLGPTWMPASEDLAECPDGNVASPSVTQAVVNQLEMLPGQSAHDPIADNIPAYVDIIGVESNLDGETLSVVFHLRGIPAELELNRKSRKRGSPEYMWLVHIDADGEDESEIEQFEYMLAAISSIDWGLADTPAAARLFEDVVQSELWKHQGVNEGNETILIDMPVTPRLLVSHEDNTLTLISEVPDITSESSLTVTTIDILLGFDGVSCPPNW